MFRMIVPALILSTSTSFAWMIPARTIIQKTVENRGSGNYSLEQEITFDHQGEKLVVKESWVVIDDSTMKLTVQTPKGTQPAINLQFIYNNGQRVQQQTNGKTAKPIDVEFAERPFWIKNSEDFAKFLKNLKVAPDGILFPKAIPAKTADIKHEPESFLRYSRSGGVVNYAFGYIDSAEEGPSKPGLWIEQDAFVIRKIRFPSGNTVEASDYIMTGKNLNFPRTRIYSWGNENQFVATAKIINLDQKKGEVNSPIKPSSLEVINDLQGLAKNDKTSIVADFYSRFR